MKLNMSFEEACHVLGPMFFGGYYGRNHCWRHEIEAMCRAHPKAEKGFKGRGLDHPGRIRHIAALRIKQEMSDPTSSFGKSRRWRRSRACDEAAAWQMNP